jgi:hypothetical protein
MILKTFNIAVKIVSAFRFAISMAFIAALGALIWVMTTSPVFLGITLVAASTLVAAKTFVVIATLSSFIWKLIEAYVIAFIKCRSEKKVCNEVPDGA